MKLSFIACAVAAISLVGCASTQKTIDTHAAHAHTHAHAHAHAHDDHHWSYEHPEKWGDQEVNKLCSAGKEQSPINIERVTAPLEGQVNLSENYKAQNFKVSNNGHSIVFDVDGNSESTILVNGTPYSLLQFHYHIPSEHTVMNAHYPLEIHFVHKNAQGGLAVVGVLVNSGAHNPALNQIITGLPKTGEAEGRLNNFNISTLMPANRTAYAYNGSLTTPPCGEQVQWLLKATPIDADSTQLGVLAKLYNGNNRPVQPVGNRTVTLVK